MASTTQFPTHWGNVALTRFMGPADLGEERRALQVGDDVRLSKADVEHLVEVLNGWLCDEQLEVVRIEVAVDDGDAGGQAPDLGRPRR